MLGSSEFAEVFLTDVRVPVANRVGAENDGWRVTNVTLKYERGTAFVSELVDSLRLCDDLAPHVRDAGVPARELGRCAPSSTRCGRSRSATCRSRREGSPAPVRW